MMRYQRVSPDGLPSSNGNKKPNSRTTTTCKQDINGDNGRIISNRFLSSTTSFESKPFRFRSPSRTIQDVNGAVNGAPDSPSISDHQNHASHSPSRVGGGDGLLQWGIKKRARVSRSDIRSLADDESSSSSAVNKVQRRAMEADKMLPPPPPPQQSPTSAASNSRIANPRTENPIFLPTHHRKLEERSGTRNGSPSRSGVRSVSRSSTAAAGKRSPPAMEKIDRKLLYSRSVKDEKTNASVAQAADTTPAQSAQEAMATNTSTGLEKKGSVEVIEWPRIYISLSRKEKEEDFLAMKGTKLPQRPKKRAKNVDKTLQFCFPGMWLSDLTKSRYEVREKKSVKKRKRRGLKGMGSMDSDSE
ncbi:myosin-1-like isoform X3 [Tripterygium wilfordii]|uniref:Myosin-1-like isoform X3 n=1 Tax=Tripterygium wilfordii TaxID=458696 RepID=A0A7J7D7V9_TRIWF|nr:uncharacterized protein LOC120005537 [Tripterygium wilfordii]KAF5742401.1 myosin-1-like isoform X3 [Tripterygium wilfordii]